MNSLLTLLIAFTVFSMVKASVNLREPIRNEILSGEEKGTLDKVKVIGHMSSGRCLIVENGKRQGERRENQLVLWSCHDRLIKGLEQEMFTLVKSNGGGYLIMGYAGSDKCVAAERGYLDHVITRECDPLDNNQSWMFRRVEGSKDKYQTVQMSTGRCMTAPGSHNGAWVRVGDCDLSDEQQMWQVCGLDGSCDF